MKLIIRSKIGVLDKRFLEHMIARFPRLVFNKENKRRLKAIEPYLNTYILKSRRRYSVYQVVMVILRNITFETNNKSAIIQIDPAAIFPYTTMKIKDVASFIDKGNLDIKGTHVFHNMFQFVENNIEQIRRAYEMGLI